MKLAQQTSHIKAHAIKQPGAAFDVGSSVMLHNHFERFCSQIKGAVSRNSAKLSNYKMPVKLRET